MRIHGLWKSILQVAFLGQSNDGPERRLDRGDYSGSQGRVLVEGPKTGHIIPVKGLKVSLNRAVCYPQAVKDSRVFLGS